MADPGWHYDPAFASALLGKVVLVGLTYRNRQDEVESREQVHGVVESVDEEEGIVLRLQGERAGERFCLPPVTNKFERAAPGEYHLKGRKEVVNNPDWLVVWTVHLAGEAQEGS